MAARQWIERQLECEPWSVAAAWSRRPGSLLLHDAAVDGQSALFFSPRWSFRWNSDGRHVRDGAVPSQLPLRGAPASWPLRWMSAVRKQRRHEPLYCGVAGGLSYELGGMPFGALAARPAAVSTPTLWLALYDRVLVFGPGFARLIVADLAPLQEDSRPLRARWEAAAEELLTAGGPAPSPVATSVPRLAGLDPIWHRRACERIQHYLRAGDVYQINLTAQLLAHADVDPFELFRLECARNPVAHAAFAQLGDVSVASHSPELLLSLRGREALSSPIKGTAKLGAPLELAQSAKDRAEHVMIVDLVRNDLGRSAVPGSVEVSALMRPLELRELCHLVSDVRSRARRSARDAILADLFPGGSITGAPKRRAIEIIAELEPQRRGIYTGSIGFADLAGFARWNIAIRTAVWQNGRVGFGCGGGIVLDSDPEQEYAEAMLKAESFLESLRQLSRRPLVSPCSSTSKEI